MSFGLIFGTIGCSEKLAPDTFYRLSADGPAPQALVENPEIGVGPIDMPDYIDRQELVFQSSESKFEIPSNHRWAGSLQKNISTVLTTNLARRMKPFGVVSYPFANDISPEIRVAIRVHQFHALSGGDAVLEATWFISDGDTEKVRTGSFTEPLEQDGYEGVVAAKSKLVGKLADAVKKDLEGTIAAREAAGEVSGPEEGGEESDVSSGEEEGPTESP